MRLKIPVFIIVFSCLLLCHHYADGRSIKKRKIKKMFKHSVILNDHFTGFALYDIDKKKMIYELNADKYFTPASNTKLFTFYTCLKMLGDSIPAFKYLIHHDSLIFWGVGDPSFLHTDLKGVRGFNFLKNSGKQLYFAAGDYTNDFYGSGWSWNDYNDYYQAEITELPLENNTVEVYADKHDSLKISPAYFARYLQHDSTYKPGNFKVKRDYYSDTFIYPKMALPAKFSQQIPWKASTDLTIALLQDTLKMLVTAIHLPMDSSAKVVYDTRADSVYKYMLQNSDNFIAEQLLLVCSATKFNTLNTDSVINYAKTHFLNDLPDEPEWVDGSGLSRYNMCTPRSIIALLNKILELKDEKLLHSLLPQGGVAGTLKTAYKTDRGQVFVWAKTGSLLYDYNQSGYLVTRKGKRLAFCFMNNNFTHPTSQVRDEMVRIMTFIHDNY